MATFLEEQLTKELAYLVKDFRSCVQELTKIFRMEVERMEKAKKDEDE